MWQISVGSVSSYLWIAFWIAYCVKQFLGVAYGINQFIGIACGVNQFLGVAYGVNQFLRIRVCRIVDC